MSKCRGTSWLRMGRHHSSRTGLSYPASKSGSAQSHQSIGCLFTRMFNCRTVIASLYVHWMWYPVLGILLGSAFFGYFILIIHEASHNMLFLSSNSTTRKNLNRGGTIATTIFTEYIRHWQEGHVTHAFVHVNMMTRKIQTHYMEHLCSKPLQKYGSFHLGSYLSIHQKIRP